MADSTDPTLIELPPQECKSAGAVLGRAFCDDPLWVAVFPDHELRPGLLTNMFTALAKATLAARGRAETTLRGEGVALWLPPGEDLGFWAMVKSGFTLPLFAVRLPGVDRKRMLAVLGQLGDRRNALMPDPHWYLSAIGVDPEHQGEGLGSALVRSGIHRADDGNMPIYLETETEGNVRFYENLGFEVIEEVTAT
ncbi:MAG: GNAT family N-acetyltransferase, partial [Acidimicrobiales bacterium]